MVDQKRDMLHTSHNSDHDMNKQNKPDIENKRARAEHHMLLLQDTAALTHVLKAGHKMQLYR